MKKIIGMRSGERWRLLAIPIALMVYIGCTGPEASGPVTGIPVRLALRHLSSIRGTVSELNGETIAFAAGTSPGTYSEIWESRVNGKEAVPLQSHYYPEDGSRLYLRGYYPMTEPGSNGVVYRLDGSQDLLVSKKFTFKHLLTQLNIRVRVEEGYPEGACLTRMQIGGSHPEVLLDLNKATLMAIGEPAVLTIWEPDGTGVLLSGSYTDTPTATVMLEAGIPLTFFATVSLPDGTSLDYEALPIRFIEADSLPRPGVSYTLSVVLNAEKEKLTLSTTVADWTEKDGGEVEF
ncbi:fimbrillin family protein [Parabacteroides goldsteinii]|uniref:fimbrillin family protein n=1 Tax=Parabacteroides goldsteinii TaxID=328812 RepID=UPI0024330056|nr:fimbrillin family protein [Parabacteroides goldsteinii]